MDVEEFSVPIYNFECFSDNIIFDEHISIKKCTEDEIDEIKGVQKLNLIGQVVKYEVQRQVALLKLRDELKQRGVRANQITKRVHEVTPLFKKSTSKVIKGALKRKEGVFALMLPGFAGFCSSAEANSIQSLCFLSIA